MTIDIVIHIIKNLHAAISLDGTDTNRANVLDDAAGDVGDACDWLGARS